jgi:hypothetical protein
VRSYARVPPGTAVPYRHRDPAWVTPARRAELEAGDRHREQLARAAPEPLTRAEQAAARLARMQEYLARRDAGMSPAEAAAETGIGRRAAREYDRARRQA